MSQEKQTETQEKNAPEKPGVMRFFREIGSALAMALVAIVYVIQAFQIPSASMEDSLLVGDFLLGLKFVYGAPLVPYSQELGIKTRFPAVKEPQVGDVVIFKYPGLDNKDYIKRMVAGPRDVISIIDNNTVLVNGAKISLPPKGKYTANSRVDKRIGNFAPLYIPAKGDVLVPSTMSVREFLFFRNLLHQENPTKRIRMTFNLFVDGVSYDDTLITFSGARISMRDLQSGKLAFRNDAMQRMETFDFNRFDDWTSLDYYLNMITERFEGRDVELRKRIYLDNEEIETYTVEFDNYFMLGDNRDNSLDSRYWGYLNKNFVKAKAFILYFSYDGEQPAWRFPLNIRYNRIGKLIRDWDGVTPKKERVKY